MIQDILPSRLYNEYQNCIPDDDDVVFVFDGNGKALLKEEGNHAGFLRKADVGDVETVYLFAIDRNRFFLCLNNSGFQKEGFACRILL